MFFGREVYVSIVVLAAALLVLAALLASPARAQVISGDRNQTNICNNIVNIILRDVQNPGVVVRNEQVVSGDVSNEQMVDIAQELNISPVIVQQCIQQNASRDAIIGDDDNNNGDNIGNDDNNDGNNNDDGNDTGVLDSGTSTIEDCIIVEEEVATSTESGSAADSATATVTGDTGSNVSAAAEECTIIDTAPNKSLPVTGGWPMMYYSIVAGFVLVGASLLGTGFVVWRVRQG